MKKGIASLFLFAAVRLSSSPHESGSQVSGSPFLCNFVAPLSHQIFGDAEKCVYLHIDKSQFKTMTREESRTRNALEKVSNKCRKQVAKRFGWKQNDYLNWKIDSGYYFSLRHFVLEKVELSVKPYFIDDLWWDIFEMPDNKQAPKSLRGNGAFAAPDISLKEYVVFDTGKIPVYTEEDVVSRWENTFNTIEADIAHFINENPNPDIYCPTGRTNRNRVYELLMDIHSGNLKQALDKIDLFKANPIGVGFRGPKGYDYEYIERWINEQER